MNATKMSTRKTSEELKKESLDCCLQFLKDFGLCPYVVNRRLCFYVWHTVQESIGQADHGYRLTNDPRNSQIAPVQMGKVFTLAEFIVFFYRICIFTFDQTDHGTHIMP